MKVSLRPLFPQVLGMLLLCSACQPDEAQIASLRKQAIKSTGSLGLIASPKAADAEITRMNLEDAELLLNGAVGPAAAQARARLALYRGDCEGAVSALSSRSLRQGRRAEFLFEFAKGCQGATLGSTVIEDEERGVWLRLQDEQDKVLAPWIIQVAHEARETLEKDLGIDLPRPLRIDLVRDLYSLGLVSSLPVEAAETTGTVAVAKWGRVTMITPRAPVHGYPWQDTLAHEITHLLLSRGSADRAPLWLQEGIAKREETRWRSAWFKDVNPDPARIAFEAEREGRAVGITKIGPSIALLPSADIARVAYAEVTSFMDFWIKQNGGSKALSLLIRDLAVTKDADSAMRSVSGYSAEEWEKLYRKDLAERFSEEQKLLSSPLPETGERSNPRQLRRVLRLSELLLSGGYAADAAELSARELDRAPRLAVLRFAAARAGFLAGRADVNRLLGEREQVDSAHAGWLALRARLDATLQSSGLSEAAYAQALARDPYQALVACRGAFHPWVVRQVGENSEARVIKVDSSFPELDDQGFRFEDKNQVLSEITEKELGSPSKSTEVLSAEQLALCHRAQARLWPGAL